MTVAPAQRFIYTLLVLVFASILALVLLNVYSLEVFVVLLIIEFLVITELTEPFYFKTHWRRNLLIFIVPCILLWLVISYQNIMAALR